MPEVELIDMRQEFQETGQEQVISRGWRRRSASALERERAGDGSAEPARIFTDRALPHLRQDLECKNCAIAHDAPQSVAARWSATTADTRRPSPKVCPSAAANTFSFLAPARRNSKSICTAFPAGAHRSPRSRHRSRTPRLRARAERTQSGELDLLVGTQMIAKGHDFHGVTLVGVVGADFALRFPDFRAAERTFQLLTQVAGRAGRGTTPGKVILQTYFPDHYAMQFAQQHDFNGFADKELQFRRWMHYPPFTAVANVLVRSDKLDLALRYSGEIGKWVEKTRMEGVRVMGPPPRPSCGSSATIDTTSF